MGGKPNFFTRIFKPFYHVSRHLLFQPVTHKYPIERIRGYPRTRGYISLNIDTCIGCGACGYICPDEAIRFFPIEGKKFTYPAIDFGKCSFCGLCVETCPTGSLSFSDVVELAGEKYRDLVYMPEDLKPIDLKNLLPEMKVELKTTITENGPRYIRRRVGEEE
jgi:formate hydrogenlyase subunit 6/NADH:ubiquinone oxidoreductase subunit I